MPPKATPSTLKQQTLHNCEITWTAPVPKPLSVMEEDRKDIVAAETTPLPVLDESQHVCSVTVTKSRGRTITTTTYSPLKRGRSQVDDEVYSRQRLTYYQKASYLRRMKDLGLAAVQKTSQINASRRR